MDGRELTDWADATAKAAAETKMDEVRMLAGLLWMLLLWLG